jgi:integrase/recombinase XerD
MQLQIAVKSFLLDRRASRLKPTTVQWYDFMLSRFMDGIDLDDLDGIQPFHVRQYLFALQEDESWKDTSQHGMARALRAFFNWAVDEELIPNSPMTKVKMPKQDKRILPSFTESEVRTLLAACRIQRDKSMVLFLLDTGLRATENLGLRMGNVDLKHNAVFVSLGKGGKDRYVYFGSRTETAIWAYFRELGRVPGETETLWQTCYGKPLTIWGQRMIFRRLAERTGIAQDFSKVIKAG